MQLGGWSEPTTTNAPVEDESVEAVLGMNQKHILPARTYCFFPPFLWPKIFFSYLPPFHLPLPSYLHLPPRTFHLPPLRTCHLLSLTPSPQFWSNQMGGEGFLELEGLPFLELERLPLLELERLPLLELECLKRYPRRTESGSLR